MSSTTKALRWFQLEPIKCLQVRCNRNSKAPMSESLHGRARRCIQGSGKEQMHLIKNTNLGRSKAKEANLVLLVLKSRPGDLRDCRQLERPNHVEDLCEAKTELDLDALVVDGHGPQIQSLGSVERERKEVCIQRRQGGGICRAPHKITRGTLMIFWVFSPPPQPNPGYALDCIYLP